jgi:predicted nucleic acid-binding protein
MSFMTAAVFVDTNVIVYAYDRRDPAKKATAEALLRELWIEQRGRTSMQVLAEYYSTVTRKLKPALPSDAAWEQVDVLLAWEPLAIDRGLLDQAREVERRYRLSWWDSMIVAAAQLQNCTVLMTEDLQHGLVCGTVVVRNPFVANIADDVGHYAVDPRPLSRHRPRGRPRLTRPPAAQRS